jgi:antitoxin ParD1/3/4
MNVSLTKELESLVNKKVKSGMYQTASEVVREGLRLLKERDQLEWLRREIQLGFEDIERGDYTEYDETTTEDLKADIRRRGMARLAAQEKKRKTGTK